MRQSTGADVIPAKAGIQMCRRGWMPAPYRSTGQAYAGMTYPVFSLSLAMKQLFNSCYLADTGAATICLVIISAASFAAFIPE
jgi:hypothetical protein